MKKFFLFLVFLPMAACKQGGDNFSKAESITTESLLLGKQYLEMYCYACHSPEASMDERIAPPMAAVKNHYIDDNTTEEEFLKAFSSWIKKPSEITSKMPGAISNFGLMPYTPYPDSVIEKIGAYLYHYDMDTPLEVDTHMRNGNGIERNKRMRKEIGWEETKISYRKQGMEIAMSTQATLGKNLLGTIKKKGIKAALEFCSERALPLTDSMSMVRNAKIRRVSNRFRNPANEASPQEKELITTYQEQLDESLDLKPVIDSSGSYIQFYYPIITNELCLKCHGNLNSTIDTTVWESIQLLYPKDHATGYQVNQVRGLWSIQMEKE